MSSFIIFFPIFIFFDFKQKKSQETRGCGLYNNYLEIFDLTSVFIKLVVFPADSKTYTKIVTIIICINLFVLVSTENNTIIVFFFYIMI